MKYLKNVSSLQIDHAKCTGCGMCVTVCPHQILELQDKKVVIFDLDSCMECSACSINCPFEAITVAQGVGCATAVLYSKIKGGEPSCGCDSDCCSSTDSGCC